MKGFHINQRNFTTKCTTRKKVIVNLLSWPAGTGSCIIQRLDTHFHLQETSKPSNGLLCGRKTSAVPRDRSYRNGKYTAYFTSNSFPISIFKYLFNLQYFVFVLKVFYWSMCNIQKQSLSHNSNIYFTDPSQYSMSSHWRGLWSVQRKDTLRSSNYSQEMDFWKEEHHHFCEARSGYTKGDHFGGTVI